MDYAPFPDKRYSVIYADPPWTYRDKANAGKRGAAHKYTTQSQAWIEGLPVRQLALPDCALFLWVTMPKLDEVFGGDLFRKWGFTFKTCAFTWVKMNKRKPSLFWGMGGWTRANAEICLLATRGKPKRIAANVHSVIQAPSLAHSEKPHETRDRIVQLMGDIPRIELFARQRVDGWDSWGDEV